MARLLFSLLVLLSGMAIGYGLHQPVGASITIPDPPPAQIIEKRVPEYVFVRTTSEVRLVEVEKPVIQYVPYTKPVRLWKDIAEFEEWFKSLGMVVASGNCDDQAELIQSMAIQEGRPVSIAPVYGGYFFGTYIPWMTGQYHAGLFIMTQESSLWYVEPDPLNFRSKRLEGIRYSGR